MKHLTKQNLDHFFMIMRKLRKWHIIFSLYALWASLGTKWKPSFAKWSSVNGKIASHECGITWSWKTNDVRSCRCLVKHILLSVRNPDHAITGDSRRKKTMYGWIVWMALTTGCTCFFQLWHIYLPNHMAHVSLGRCESCHSRYLIIYIVAFLTHPRYAMKTNKIKWNQ